MDKRKAENIEYEIDLYGVLPFIYQSIQKIIDKGKVPGNLYIFLPEKVLGLKVEIYATQKNTKRKNQRIP